MMNPKRKAAPRAKPRATLHIGIIEDDHWIRDSLQEMLNAVPGFRCTQAFSSCETALEAFARKAPQVLLTDIGLPGMSGVEGARIVKARFPEIDIIMLTVYDDDEKIFQSICAGASGYILKNAPSEELIRAIREIHTGAPMSATIARRVLSLLREGGARPSADAASTPDASLTPRETEILQSLVDGLSYRRIAEKLFISPLTVHTHIKRIYEKLHVHSKSAAVSKALKHRLIR